eukprot:1161188-Pelagomonas_calceolata.AAC.15
MACSSVCKVAAPQSTLFLGRVKNGDKLRRRRPVALCSGRQEPGKKPAGNPLFKQADSLKKEAEVCLTCASARAPHTRSFS